MMPSLLVPFTLMNFFQKLK